MAARSVTMEVKEALKRRRSLRCYEPDRPVDREKMLTIPKAVRLASGGANAQWLCAIVLERDNLVSHALKSEKPADVLDLAEVGEAMSEAHVANGALDHHLTERLDGDPFLEEVVVLVREEGVGRLPDISHILLEVFLGIEAKRLGVLLRHPCTLGVLGEREAIVPASIYPHSGLAL